MSSTLPAQDDQLFTGGWLSSGSSNYLVQSFLGQGAFGKVVKCTRMDDMKTVAIKMMKNEGSYVMQAKEEVAALLKLKSLDSDKCNLVRWYQVFSDKGHNCLEFEHLDKSLYDFMKERYFRPLLLKEIRPIVQQLATALDHLKAVGIIHADLKMENVMLVDHVREPYRVKVIDFGLACNVSAARLGSYIQTRPYRSPEIILGLPFTEAIDMWSLGCMAATLYLGTLLYPGRSEYDMMRYIVETQGQPPDNLLSLGHMTGCFFQRDYNSTTSLWKLKTPEQFHQETGIQPVETRRLKFSSLDGLMHVWHTWVSNPENAADKVGEMVDLLMFVDMLKGMLQLDATKRITPSQVLEHQFTSMCHMISMYPLSSHVRSCFEIMDICQSQTLTSDSGKTVCGSSQQPSSSTTQPIQQNLPCPPPAERSGLSQPHCNNSHPCTSTQTTSSVMSGMKRKVDDEDGHMSETSHPSKRIKSRWHSSSSSWDSTNYIQASSALRSHVVQTFHHSINAYSSKSSPTKSCIGPGIKRQVPDVDDVGHQQSNSDHHERSADHRKRYQRSYSGPSTSSSSNLTQSCLSPRVKRKLAYADDSDYYERSDHKRKRVRKSYAGRYTCSSYDRRSGPAEHHRHSEHSSNTQTESRTRSGLKRKAADDDNVPRRKRTSDLRTLHQ
ncbi:homeodomain-interacting protein kinase 1-like isoform X2 [Siniperca chuatsi]|uniref:homeodomain-interacting protein kinase 1-like isoform X2 n=1 Tax=Siniperca chuatsi TaxID=119488 RepID=UPI001CE08EC8|nr:homeodomain-interacting protein kinase 1-like isoform X2 [Siniperca chuatsi]